MGEITMLSGVELIAAERERQINEEGWTPEHDDAHCHGELAIAAARYAVHGTDARVVHAGGEEDPTIDWLKFDGEIRELVKAGALIAAEIDRKLRQATPTTEPPTEGRDEE